MIWLPTQLLTKLRWINIYLSLTFPHTKPTVLTGTMLDKCVFKILLSRKSMNCHEKEPFGFSLSFRKKELHRKKNQILFFFYLTFWLNDIFRNISVDKWHTVRKNCEFLSACNLEKLFPNIIVLKNGWKCIYIT